MLRRSATLPISDLLPACQATGFGHASARFRQCAPALLDSADLELARPQPGLVVTDRLRRRFRRRRATANPLLSSHESGQEKARTERSLIPAATRAIERFAHALDRRVQQCHRQRLALGRRTKKMIRERGVARLRTCKGPPPHRAEHAVRTAANISISWHASADTLDETMGPACRAEKQSTASSRLVARNGLRGRDTATNHGRTLRRIRARDSATTVPVAARRHSRLGAGPGRE